MPEWRLALASTAGAADAPALRTAAVQYREVAQTYAAEGVVEAVKQSTVAAQISGRVVAVNFDVGDRVKKGQVIVRIDPAEVNQAYAASQAQIAQAQATLRNAKAQYERTQQLVRQKFMSAAALDKAQADYQAAKAQLAAARGRRRPGRGHQGVCNGDGALQRRGVGATGGAG